MTRNQFMRNFLKDVSFTPTQRTLLSKELPAYTVFLRQFSSKDVFALSLVKAVFWAKSQGNVDAILAVDYAINEWADAQEDSYDTQNY